MSREEKNKFGNFVHEQRKKEDEILEICQDIFRNSRTELAVSMHFFQSALSGLKVVPSAETQVIGTDGKLLYVSPQWLLPMFMQNKIQINRLYLHELLHCLFCHLWSFTRNRCRSDRTVSGGNAIRSGERIRRY